MRALEGWSPLACDRGSATVVAVGMIAGLIAMTGSVASVSTALIAKRGVEGAADAAALAAADVASGAAAGYPCATAAEVSRLNGAELIECSVSGYVAQVETARRILVFEVRARARAGPPTERGP